MSEVIVDFAKPLLDQAEGHESKEKAIGLAIVCWNLYLLPKHQQKEERERVLQMFPEESVEVINGIIDSLLQTRTVYFHTFKKFIMDYEVFWRGDNLHLTVASTEI